MGYINEQTKASSDWDTAQVAFPSLPLKVRVTDALVRYFPRRLFKWVSPEEQDKIVSHAIFFSKPLNGIRSVPLLRTMEFGVAGHDVVREMASHSEALPGAVYSKRMENGDFCYYLKVDGSLVCYNWVSLDCFCIYGGFPQEIRFQKPKSEMSAYTYDFYTYSESRGSGYGSLLKNRLLYDLAIKGYDRVYGCVHSDTRASLRVHKQAGYQVFGIAYMYRLMRFSVVLWANRATREKVRIWFDKYV